MLPKRKYSQDRDIDVYQRILRTVSHRYIDLLKAAKDENGFLLDVLSFVNKYCFQFKY